MPVAYPACFARSAAVVSFNGRPVSPVGPNTPGTPIRVYCLPVINAARLPEQTGQPEYHEDRILPLNASLSMFGVLVVGCPLKPTSPYPTGKIGGDLYFGNVSLDMLVGKC